MNLFQTIFFWIGVIGTILFVFGLTIVLILMHDDRKYEEQERHMRERWEGINKMYDEQLKNKQNDKES
jgi:hypothetical protein